MVSAPTPHILLIKEMSFMDFSRLLENKCDGGNKGSSWMQGLKPNCEELEICQEEPAKKKLRNIVHGGLAEKMLKL
ncbi:hypothetical protein JTE90_021897 [Oedothorax gibbosus]|uniref:Uncharacterized protein n=1 Tax=Oedothorax gibbosus TaxID=931172 RepID=A0AAV6TGC3_9ARAC|nr:hypothetical protein JTE90_021897 [Oedothorax gibbosus]